MWNEGRMIEDDEGWLKMMKDEWRLMKDDDFKLLRGFEDEQTDGQTDEQTNGWMDICDCRVTFATENEPWKPFFSSSNSFEDWHNWNCLEKMLLLTYGTSTDWKIFTIVVLGWCDNHTDWHGNEKNFTLWYV